MLLTVAPETDLVPCPLPEELLSPAEQPTPRRHQLAEIADASAAGVVRISWADSWAVGTVQQFCRPLFFYLLDGQNERDFAIDAIPDNRGMDLIIQGRAGAISGVLSCCRPRRRWYWADWRLLECKAKFRWVRFDDPRVIAVSHGIAGPVDFAAIVAPRPTRSMRYHR